MPREVAWKLVVDETGAVKRMEIFDKAAEKTDKTVDKTKRTTDEASRSIKHMGGAFGSLKSVMGAAIGALGIGGMAYGLNDIVNKTMEVSKETEKFRAVTGLGSQASLDYVAALKARGVGSEAFSRAYKVLAKNIQTAERQQYSYAVGQEKAHMQGKLYTSQIGVQAQALQKLGISYTTLKALAPEKQLELVTKKLEGMKAGMEKTTLMADLMGRGATQLAPVFEKGALGLTSFLRAAKEYFPIVHGGARGEEELIANQEKAKLAWEGLEMTLGEKVAPALTVVYGDFSKVIGSIEKGHGVWGTLGKDLGFVYTDLKGVVNWLGQSKFATDLLIPALGLLGAAWGVEKVIGFYEAVKKLTLLNTLVNAVTGFGRAMGILPALEESAAAETGAFGAALDTIMPELLAIAAAYAAYKAVLGTGKSTLIHQPSLEETMNRIATGTPYSVKQMIRRDTGYGHTEISGAAAHETHAGDIFRERILERNREIEAYAHQHHESLRQADRQYQHGQIPVVINIDGRKVAEGFVKNPNTQRYLGEAAERAGLSRNSRR